jgi:tetratricopeptide (TPR) repeat protein
MNKLQIVILIVSLSALLSLLFLFDNHKSESKSITSEAPVSNDFSAIIEKARTNLNSNLQDTINFIEQNLTEQNKQSSLLKISGIYQENKKHGIAALYFLYAYDSNDSISNYIKGRWVHMQVPKVRDQEIRSHLILETERIYQNIIKTDSNNVETNYYYANLLIYEKNMIMPGVQKLLAISRSNPEFKPAQYQLGLLAIRSGQYNKAIKRFENIIKEVPESIDILLPLGKAYYLSGNKNKSNELFKRCQNLASDDKKDMVDKYISSIVNV